MWHEIIFPQYLQAIFVELCIWWKSIISFNYLFPIPTFSQSPFSQTFTFIVVIWCYFDMLYLLKGNKSYPQGEIFPDILKALSRLHWCCFLSEFHHKRLRYLKTPAIAFFFVKHKFPTRNIIRSVECDLS